MSAHPLWDYREEDWGSRDFVGYSVDALDGHVGKVDPATDLVDATCIVVNVGRRFFGKKIVIPVGLIGTVDDTNHTLVVDRMRSEIEDAPAYDDELFYDEEYREELGAHYLGDRVTGAPWDQGKTA